jgi:hypothetical protein
MRPTSFDHFGIARGLRKSQYEPVNTSLRPSGLGNAINASATRRQLLLYSGEWRRRFPELFIDLWIIFPKPRQVGF